MDAVLRNEYTNRRTSSFALPAEVLAYIASALRSGPSVQPQTNSLLLTLPTELICLTASFLNLPSLTALRWSSRQLYCDIPPPRRISISELVEIESWPEYTSKLGYLANFFPQAASAIPYAQDRDLFACAGCLKLRTPDHFSTNMLERGYSKSFRAESSSKESMYRNVLRRFLVDWRQEADVRPMRLCIDCGIAQGKYWPGTTVRFGSPWSRRDSVERGVGIVCRSCGHFEDLRFEQLEGGSKTSQVRMCSRCSVPEEVGEQEEEEGGITKPDPMAAYEEAILDDWD